MVISFQIAALGCVRIEKSMQVCKSVNADENNVEMTRRGVFLDCYNIL